MEVKFMSIYHLFPGFDVQQRVDFQHDPPLVRMSWKSAGIFWVVWSQIIGVKYLKGSASQLGE